MGNLSLEPNSILSQVGQQLAIIGDDINRRYDTEFQNLLEQLQPTAGNAYELFTKIASRPAATFTACLRAASAGAVWWLSWVLATAWPCTSTSVV